MSFNQNSLNILGDWTVEAWFKDETPPATTTTRRHCDEGRPEPDGEAPYIVQIA